MRWVCRLSDCHLVTKDSAPYSWLVGWLVNLHSLHSKNHAQWKPLQWQGYGVIDQGITFRLPRKDKDCFHHGFPTSTAANSGKGHKAEHPTPLLNQVPAIITPGGPVPCAQDPTWARWNQRASSQARHSFKWLNGSLASQQSLSCQLDRKFFRVYITLILPRSRTGTVWFYTSTSNKRAGRPKLYTKSLTRDLKLMYSRFTMGRISIKL